MSISYISWVNNIQSYINCTYRTTNFENAERIVVSSLDKPDGIDVIWIKKDANNIGNAYNIAKEVAKNDVKTFIHQDAMIVDPYFEDNIFKKFGEDDSIELIGHIGSLNENVIPWWNLPSDCRGQILQGFNLAFWDKFNGECSVVDPFCFTTKSNMDFSEEYFGPHFIEYDYCKRLRLNQKKIHMIESLVCHLSGGELNDDWNKSREVFRKKFNI